MCGKSYCRADPDEAGNKVMEEFLAHSTPEQVRALYFISEGSVRVSIEAVVKTLIAKGNAALAAEFPTLTQDIDNLKEIECERYREC